MFSHESQQVYNFHNSHNNNVRMHKQGFAHLHTCYLYHMHAWFSGQKNVTFNVALLIYSITVLFPRLPTKCNCMCITGEGLGTRLVVLIQAEFGSWYYNYMILTCFVKLQVHVSRAVYYYRHAKIAWLVDQQFMIITIIIKSQPTN